MSDSSVPAGEEKPHAVCLPFPAQGHITPMLKLAKILHTRGFRITFVNTEYNHRRLVRARGPDAVAGLPDFRFATISDGLPASDADATQDPATISHATKYNCPAHFRTLLTKLRGVTCVVADNLMSFSVDAAREVGVPCALFWTASAYEEQLTNGFMDMPVDWAPGMSKHMRLKDFPSFLRTTDRNDILMTFQLHEVERSEDAAAVILNTFDELEQPALDAMRAIIPAVYTIGPLASLAEHLVPRGGPLDANSANLWLEDHACLAWLDGKPPRSVVYVNYGSVTVMSEEELAEFAWGLANSGRDFLWIVRPDIVNGDVAGAMPPGFMDATRGRGRLASWCDQEAVLRHEAVGLFLTHSGWNSTTESLAAGVPMLCWPFFAEQQTNARYKCVVWGVGMEVGDDVRREAVEGRIREAMDGEKGEEMRRRAAEWKEAAARSIPTALANLDELVNNVLFSGVSSG
ncbi:hypothetical protein PR202_ga01789 [Eleusine coracana subsp. coracana]|uniref:Glycosyltransferase n=1 Tax=Eleusine coracana subsp. coracana TaxID=191504 RepID=A0AAV5BJ34_ELECO|nr:hypothetical protein PR202_ga01102 [Eleusine coracana subsp. coracana]GJM85976.1 hypothetical protein PR202_ga01789 [Eleusine coracana subsp. coracana]